MVFPGINFKNKDIDYGTLITTNDNITYSLHINDIYIFKYTDFNNYQFTGNYNINVRATYHIKPINNPDELGDKDSFVMVYDLKNDIKFNNNIVQFNISNPPIHDEPLLSKIPNFTGLFSFKLNYLAMNRFAKWLNKYG